MSARRRGATGLAGVLAVDKPTGLTSHDIVARIRRLTGEGRVGHAGTLDPLATGLLVILVGPATRLEPYLSAKDKSYVATISFGTRTDTDDADGAPVETADVEDHVFDTEFARETLESIRGDALQTPPAYSAIKVGGQTAHRAARSGAPIELRPRPITVFDAELLGVDATARTWDVAFRVSKGTYIRSLARDLGEKVGSVAHLATLRRTASGALRIEDADTLDRIVDSGLDALTGAFVDPVRALGITTVAIDPALVTDGRPLATLPADVGDGTRIALTDDAGMLLAVYRREGDRAVADAVFPTPIGGSR